MADKPVNQAPEQSDALFSVYARKNNTTNTFSQIPENQFANAVGKTASNKGEIFYVDANGDVAELSPGSNTGVMYLTSGLPAWGAAGSNGQVLTLAGGVPTWGSVTLTDVQTFTSSGTWTKPSGCTFVQVWLWGAGGSGGKSSTGASDTGGGGGGGGACIIATFLASVLGSTVTVTIGAGAAGTTSTGSGTNGGNSTFGSHLTGYGGGGGTGSTTNSPGGGGGGWLSAPTTGNKDKPGGPAVWSPTRDSNGADGQAFGGGWPGDSTTEPGQDSTYGGGGGGGSDGTNSIAGAGGDSVFGGGGGGAGNLNTGAGGASVFGGAGGAGSNTGVATGGTQPGGGGGGTRTGTTGGGGAGKCVVYCW